MTFLHLVAGAGGMYCGSCLQGNTLARALRDLGEDVLLLPMYTPLRTDEEDISLDRVAFGGINVYLQQQSALFRHTPWLFDRLLNSPRLRRWATRNASSAQPEQLGRLTVSMLRGKEGRQSKELEKLVRWLKEEIRPDLIHLNNLLLAGVARELTRQLDVPVVCTLSGEDIFLEKLPQPYRDQAREILIERCADLAALVAMNGYYADVMAEYLCVNREKIDVIRPGLNLDGIEPTRSPQPESDTRVIGYLARVCHEKGLHQLVEALTLLVDDPALPAVRLLAAGYLGDADRPYLDTVARQLAERGMSERFEYVGELDRTEKIAFLQSLDVMSVPTVYRESKGLSILEAWANGVPTVLPAHGTFPELTEQTGGGLLCEPGNPTSLAESLKRILVDPALATKHTTAAQATVHREFNAQRMAQETLQLYDRVCGHRQVRRVRPDAP